MVNICFPPGTCMLQITVEFAVFCGGSYWYPYLNNKLLITVRHCCCLFIANCQKHQTYLSGRHNRDFYSGVLASRQVTSKWFIDRAPIHEIYTIFKSVETWQHNQGIGIVPSATVLVHCHVVHSLQWILWLAPVDGIYGHPIFKWVAMTWLQGRLSGLGATNAILG